MLHDDLQNEEGRVLTDRHVALYRDAQGQLHAITSICTQRACDVGWNDQDKVWDCPCHGSRFTPMGKVIHGPAVRPLAAVDIPEWPHTFSQRSLSMARMAGCIAGTRC